MNIYLFRSSLAALFVATFGFTSQGQSKPVTDSSLNTDLASLIQTVKELVPEDQLRYPQPTAQAIATPQNSITATPGTWLSKYFPLHEGDWKEYGGFVQNRWHSTRKEFHKDTWTGHFTQIESRLSQEAEFGASGDALLLYSLTDGATKLEFNPPLVYLTESILPKGGHVTSHSTTYYQGVPVKLSMTVSVSIAGKVTVPTATYFDCRTLAMSMTASVYGRQSTLSGTAEILAPGVGNVRARMFKNSKPVGWVGLTAGQVNGVSAQNIILETTAPTLALTSPARNAKLTNPNCIFGGQASDNVGVTAIYCELNDGQWKIASGTNTWQAPFELSIGTNVLRAYAVDACGNCSPTNMVKVIRLPGSPLTVITNGSGKISPVYNGQWLELGKPYTIAATPNSGQLFVNWADGANVPITANKICKFTMASNLVLRAGFIPDPYIPTKGNYNGIFYPETSLTPSNSGFFKATLTGKAGFSGQLLFEGQTLNCSGAFDLALHSQVTISRPGKPSLQLNLQVISDEIIGSVSTTNWTSALQAYRAAPAVSAAGNYTLLAEGDGQSEDFPPGDGGAIVTLSAKGAVRAKGALADGSPFSQTTAVSKDGKWPLYSSLYRNRGILIGWCHFGTNQTSSISTNVWIKSKALNAEKYYTNGFIQDCRVLLTRYTPPVAKQNALSWTNGSVTLAMGNLGQTLTSSFVVSNNQVLLTSSSMSNLNLTLSAKDGQFSGAFMHPTSSKQTRFTGVLTPEFGGGWFLGTNQAGSVRLQPEP